MYLDVHGSSTSRLTCGHLRYNSLLTLVVAHLSAKYNLLYYKCPVFVFLRLPFGEINKQIARNFV